MPLKQKPKQAKKTNSYLIEDFAPNLETNPRASSKKSNWKDKIITNKKPLIIGLGILILVVLLVFSVNTYTSLKDARQKLEAIENDPNAKSKEEARKIVDQIGELVVLPEGEEPTVATVTDPTKLLDQPFFANSAAGDKVLIYQEAQRAILYRPSQNKVIEIAPLNTDGVSSGGIAGDSINKPADGTNTTNKNINLNQDSE